MTDIALSHPAIQISPVTGRIGAEISGVDLSPDLDRARVAAIRQALLRHKVIFFRGQHHLDNAGQEGFAALLGEPVAHPTVPPSAGTKYTLDIASTHGGRTNSWHTDVTFVQAYPLASILRAEIIPAAGGDTVWANTATAFQDLSPELREFVGKLWALHTNDYDYAATRTDISVEHAKKFKAVFASTIYETEHPLVRVHPETGEHTLVLGHFLKKINGEPVQSSAEPRHAAGEHGALALDPRRCRDLGQQGDPALRRRRLRRSAARAAAGDGGGRCPGQRRRPLFHRQAGAGPAAQPADRSRRLGVPLRKRAAPTGPPFFISSRCLRSPCPRPESWPDLQAAAPD